MIEPDTLAPTRLLLVTPRIDTDKDLAAHLASALAAGDVAATILPVPPSNDERGLLKLLKPLIAQIQQAGAAALLDGPLDLVGKSGADGVHISGLGPARAALERFKPEKIVGVGSLRTRDAAMSAGETGADYVMFGEPGATGDLPPFDTILERVDWWAEVFVTPCVGYAPDLDSIVPLAEAGADFVALGLPIWNHPEGPAAAVARAHTLITRQGEVA